MSEGSHPLCCPRCQGSTLVHIAREGESWRITSTGSEDLNPESAPDSPSPAPAPDEAPPSPAQSPPRPGLTPGERESIREELRESLVQGQPLREVLSVLASKYSIGAESMSWYLKTADEVRSLLLPKTKEPQESAADASPTDAGAPPRTGSRARLEKLLRGRSPNGKPSSLATALSELTEADLKRLISAKKLLPRLQDSRRKEKELEIRRDRLQARLERARARAEKIELLIQKIMER